jgi:hypothetical protein
MKLKMKLNKNSFKPDFRKKLKNVKTMESFSVSESEGSATTPGGLVRKMWDGINALNTLLDEGFIDDELELEEGIDMEDCAAAVDMSAEDIEAAIEDVKRMIG